LHSIDCTQRESLLSYRQKVLDHKKDKENCIMKEKPMKEMIIEIDEE